jgi:hypothetical protein
LSVVENFLQKKRPKKVNADFLTAFFYIYPATFLALFGKGSWKTAPEPADTNHKGISKKKSPGALLDAESPYALCPMPMPY